MSNIVITPDPVLFKTAVIVPKVDAKIKSILEEMRIALISAKDPKGVGLAAPQVGYSLRIFAIKPRESSGVSFFINPQIIEKSEEEAEISKTNTPLEGCLSIPNAWGVVNRKKWVKIKYLDSKGKEKIRTFKGFESIIIQHEMDHLEGVLFTKRVLEQGHKLYEFVKDEKGKESLRELPL